MVTGLGLIAGTSILVLGPSDEHPGGHASRIARAVEVTRSQGTAGVRIEISIRSSDGGVSSEVTTRGSGEVDLQGRRWQVQLQREEGGRPGIEVPAEWLGIRRATYARHPSGRWVPAGRSGTRVSTGFDPWAYLRYVGYADAIELMGDARTTGDATTRYRSTIDPRVLEDEAALATADAVGARASVPTVDIWVDGTDRIRLVRLELNIEGRDPPGVETQIVMSMRLFAFGEPVTIESPP